MVLDSMEDFIVHASVSRHQTEVRMRTVQHRLAAHVTTIILRPNVLWSLAGRQPSGRIAWARSLQLASGTVSASVASQHASPF